MRDSIVVTSIQEQMDTIPSFLQKQDFFQQLQRYDGETWSLLFSSYGPKLRSNIAQSLSKRNLPLEWLEDIEQETWLTVIRRIENFVWESESKLYNWFRSIATFLIRNLERKLRKQYISLETIDEEVDDTGLALDFFLYIHDLIEDGPEVQVALRESLELLDLALEKLKPREREILLRRLLYNESLLEIAKDYQLKPETISVILVRTKQTIKHYLTWSTPSKIE